MLDFVLSFSVSETNNYVLMENVVKEDGFSTSNNYNLIRCTKINKFCFKFCKRRRYTHFKPFAKKSRVIMASFGHLVGFLW